MFNPDESDNTADQQGPGNGRGMPPQLGARDLIPIAPPSVTMAQSAMSQSATPDPKALLNAFRRRWLLAVGVGLVAGLCSAATAWFVIDTPYEAFSELRINAVRQKILFKTAEEQAAFQTYKQTQMRLVKSPFVLNAALRKPEVSRTRLVRLEEHPLKWLEDNIGVSSPATEFLRISLSGENPRELALIVNAVTSAYVEEVVNADENKRSGRLRSLERILHDVEEQLRTKQISQRRLAESLHTSNTETVNVKQQMAAEYFGQLRKEFAQINFDLTRTKIQLAVKQTSSQTADQVDIPDAVVDAFVSQETEFQQATQRVAQLERMLGQYKDRVGETHPRYKAVESDLTLAQTGLDKLRDKLRPLAVARIRKELNADEQATAAALEERIKLLENEKQHLGKELDKQKLEERKTGVLNFELETINKKIAQTEAISQSISGEINKLEIELQSPDRITLHRTAEVPHTRETSKKNKMTAVAGVGVFGMFVVVIVWLEFQARRISTLKEVVDGFSLRVMGALPLMPRWATNGSDDGKSSRSALWKSVLTESIDSARTMLLRDASLESINSLMVVSAVSGEGKTTLSCHLSTSLARGGRKTILIDCDMRRPSVNKVFGLEQTPGLCEVLRGEAELGEAIQESSQEGLWVLTAGQLTQDVLQILARDGANAIFDKLKQEYDFVVADSSPVMPVNDALLIAPSVDAVMLSIRRDVSRTTKVAATLQRLSMLGIPLLGTVVIGLDDGSYNFQIPYGQRYGYGYGYGQPARYGYYSQPPAQ